ncbi:MAG: SulP family inorganic anion transporter [Methylotenera sp.]|nr:SulP family inorganic anion transporter [Methylotenera sp.]MDO9233159.1 SulP family inorganic anion transporter [Methylotenera sp.]MDO9388272.1 SulP family inorganic anion transporter [Methylotenera sp.]MDP2404116.1 SulP family inorganic anion transporter [Methylotenera sp.]MDP3094316.1 SulP family inorganic anion transporter [Methylotenera sp.]
MIAILEAKRAGLLSKDHWLSNILAGVIVGIVALPLGMAFAIASGAKPEQGLYTAIVAGGLTSLLGGSRLQIAGPTGAFIVILAGITAKYGIEGLQVATLMAGVMLMLMGLTRLGGVIKFIPAPVIVGFTTGIGIIIFVGQWNDFFGLSPVTGIEHFHEKFWHLIQAVPTLQLETTALALLTLAVLLLSPRVLKRIPSPLIAMVVATVVQWFFNFEHVATIGSAFGGIPQTLPHFQVPSVTFSEVLKLIGPAFTIALLGAIESLLSAVVADGMTGTKHDSNQELIGQGVANIFSPLFGGFASTGAIARTATNIRNGGTSPLAGLAHVVTLIIIVLVLAPLAAHIPLCALSAILFVVAYNMSELHRFSHMVRTAPKSDVAVLLITFFLTVFGDLVIAVNIGVLLACLLFMKRMSEAVIIKQQTYETLVLEADNKDFNLPPETVVFDIEGPFFFGAAQHLESALEHVHGHAEVLVLRLGRVPFIDATAMQSLRDLLDTCRRHHTRLVLCEAKPNVLNKLKLAGLVGQIGSENILEHLYQINHSEKGTQ